MPNELVNYYELLGVTPRATVEEIKAQRNRMLQAFHPDHNKSSLANDLTKQINAAWETLSDPARRSEYDGSLRPKPLNPKKPRKRAKVNHQTRTRSRSRRVSRIDIDSVAEPIRSPREYYPDSSLERGGQRWKTVRKVLKWTGMAIFYVVIILIAVLGASSKRRRY
jgi:curved DNA-binding protein CbpA